MKREQTKKRRSWERWPTRKARADQANRINYPTSQPFNRSFVRLLAPKNNGRTRVTSERSYTAYAYVRSTTAYDGRSRLPIVDLQSHWKYIRIFGVLCGDLLFGLLFGVRVYSVLFGEMTDPCLLHVFYFLCVRNGTNAPRLYLACM